MVWKNKKKEKELNKQDLEKFKAEVDKMSDATDPQTEELTNKKENEEPEISAYEIELRKACGTFLAQLNQISCLLAIPLPSVLEDADNYLTMIQEEPKKESD